MTYDALKARFPNASEQFLQRNATDRAAPVSADRNQVSSPEPQQLILDAALGTAQRETGYTGRVLIRITSYRRFLLDPDNLAGGCKYFVDCCRYSGLVRGDSPADIEFAATQEKVRSKEEEKTVIIIERLTK